MILDLILKQNVYFLKINKHLFENKSFPLSILQSDAPLMQKYSYLGVFEIDGASFGFDGCFKLETEDEDYKIFKFTFPENRDALPMRKMILTIYLATYYVVEQMFYNKEFFEDTSWDDQSLSFITFDGGEVGYAIGGQLYPWFKNKLNSSTTDEIAKLNEYVQTELNRISNYLNKENLFCSQITILNNSFFIQINMGGRWISWKQNRDSNKPESFDSHNIDFRSDQEICFAAIIAINTWLREN
jgi:hypothetical protein